MSKVHESEETIQKRVCKKKLHEEKEENQSSTDDCHSADCPHNLKSKIFNYIGSFGKAPSFMQDNRFILHGYRINYDSPKKIFKSLFILHNELVNIWTHLLGALLVIFLILYIAFCLKPSIPNIKNEIQNDIQKIVSPIYEEIKNIENSLNEHTLETLKQLKEDISEYNKNIAKKYEDINENIKGKIGYIIDHLDEIKNNINKENVKYLCESIQTYLQNYTSNIIDDLPAIVSSDNFAFSALRNYSSSLAIGLDGIKTSVLEKIDSETYDWIDLYMSIQHINKDQKSVHVSRWPIFVFLISAILCLLFSAFFHLFYSMSKKACDKMICLDYAGISLLISGSTFPPLVYSFYCQPTTYIVYSSVIGVACFVVFIMSLFETLHLPEYRKIKGIIYGGLGIFAGFPIIHLIINEISKDENSLDHFNAARIVPYFLLMGVCYLSGLVIYVYQCPERFKPGKFDIWGSSHQLWHLMIIIAIIFTYFGSLEAYHGRIENKCPAV